MEDRFCRPCPLWPQATKAYFGFLTGESRAILTSQCTVGGMPLRSHDIRSRLFDVSVEQMIDYLRCGLAAVAFVACVLVPPTPNMNLVHTILAWYFVYALILTIIVKAWQSEPPWPLATHLIGIGISAFLMSLTEGSSSPCFMFFTFTLIAATLRWDWRGAIWTTLGLLVLFVLIDATWLDVGRLSRTALHCIYLLVLGLVLAYFEALRAHNRERLAKLAVWPAAEISVKPNRSLEMLLAHVADVLSCARVLVVWEVLQEPQRHFSLWSEGHLECVIEAAGEPIEQLITQSLTDTVFMIRSADSSIVWTPSGMKNCKAVVSPHLLNKYNMGALVSAPFDQPSCRGRVFALDCARPIESHLSLIELVADRVGLELEQYFLRLQIEATATQQAQVKLVRNLHDGLLQSLTAATLQLKVCSEKSEGKLLAKR